MIKNEKQYEAKMKEYSRVFRALKDAISDSEKGKLKEYYIRLNKEIRAYQSKENFLESAKKGDLEILTIKSLDNNLLKDYLPKKELIKYINYLEQGIINLMEKELKISNEIVENLNDKTSQLLSFLGYNLKEIKEIKNKE